MPFHRVLLGLFLFVFAAPAWSIDWKPVTSAELSMKTPLVQKEADAEAIFWEVHVLDQVQNNQDLQTSRTHYLRMKIFTVKGREFAKVQLEYGRKSRIDGVSGRTIKSDGTIVPMKKDAIFDAEVAKGKNIRIKAKSFTLPDVQTGDIVEYQWRETEDGALSNYLRLPLQRDIPVETVHYYVKPFSSEYLNIGMQSMTFHAEKVPFKPGLQGFSEVEYHNMPAFKEESYMPPEDELRAWVLVFYTDGQPRTAEKYWPDYGRKVYGEYKEDIKVNGDLKKAATEAAVGSTDEEKVRALYLWVRKNVKNVRSIEASADDRRAFKPNKSSIETLKQRIGTSYDIDMLFAAMATAAGFETRIAVTGDRSEQFFTPNLTDRYFLRGELVAIKLGEGWKYYDPATISLAAGSQLWEQQGTMALITDPKKPEWAKIPLSKAADARQANTARLTLDTEGTLSGSFTMKYTGHLAVSERGELRAKSPAEREQYLIDEMKAQFGSPEVTDVKWEGVDDSEAPVAVSFQMKIPNYTQRTGKRLFIQPAVFQYNEAVRFPGSTRTYPVYFHYAWSETDDITIDVPKGFEFDHPEAPAPITAGGTADWGVTASIRDGKTLVYKRHFQFGDDGNIILPASAYAGLKKIFDTIHEGNEHAIALKAAAGQ